MPLDPCFTLPLDTTISRVYPNPHQLLYRVCALNSCPPNSEYPHHEAPSYPLSPNNHTEGSYVQTNTTIQRRRKQSRAYPLGAVLKHVSHHSEVKLTSPLVSTSLSFGWALWEAVRRWRLKVYVTDKDNDEPGIMILNIKSLLDEGMILDTGVSLLSSRAPHHLRHHSVNSNYPHLPLHEPDNILEYETSLRLTSLSHEVFLYDRSGSGIPRNAVITFIPIRKLATILPSYFFSPGGNAKSPIEQLARSHNLHSYNEWDSLHAYPRICQSVLSTIHHLRIPTYELNAHATLLGLNILGPWLSREIEDDFETAVQTSAAFITHLTQWPAPQPHALETSLTKAMFAMNLRHRLRGFCESDVRLDTGWDKVDVWREEETKEDHFVPLSLPPPRYDVIEEGSDSELTTEDEYETPRASSIQLSW